MFRLDLFTNKPTPVQPIQAEIDRARGEVGQFLGQIYNVYRLNARSTGTVISRQSQVYDSLPCYMRKSTKSGDVEQSKVYEMIYEGKFDASKVNIGDIFVEQGFRSDGGMFVLAQYRPLEPYWFVRCEIAGSILREASQTVGAEPAQGLTSYQGVSKKYEWPCVLNNGLYSFQQSGTPAQVPIGIQMYKRIGQKSGVDIPTATRLEEVYCYVPNLRGIAIQASDTLADQNGNRYKVNSVQTYTVGLQGQFIVGHKLFA